MTKYTYLLVNFLTIIVPLIFTFHPRLRFYRTWWAFFPAVFLTSMFFLIWDGYYTKLGIWGFSPEYITGIYFNALPIEEVFFFFGTAYVCVYTYHSIDLFLKPDFSSRAENILTNTLIGICLLIGLLHLKQAFTAFAVLVPALLLLIAKHICNVQWLMKFYIVYGVLILPFLIVKGILAGMGLADLAVWYNEEHIFGFRFLASPIEEIFYGMGLFLMNLQIYKYLLNNVALSEGDGA